ncbi:MAG: hypothetical protein ACKO2P_14915 [Planctomycetota bacterium]
MATSLHQQLREHYVEDAQRHEVSLDGYRIDAVDDAGRLIEIQCASLAAIRDKVRDLLQLGHAVTVVKPLVALRRITTLQHSNGPTVRSRRSPAKQKPAHIFLELVHFSVFPSPGLQLDLVLTEQEEIRLPPTARSSWKKRYHVQDRRLLSVQEQVSLTTANDLWQLLLPDPSLPEIFSTAQLAVACSIPRWLAQKAAWCFRHMEFLELAGKQGNSLLYRRPTRRRKRTRAA